MTWIRTCGKAISWTRSTSSTGRSRSSRRRRGDGRSHATRFIHSLEPGDARALAAFKHPYIYDPKNDPELADRQKGGYDMERRLADLRREGIDKQIIFPTGIDIATKNAGELGAALARCYNDWVGRLVKGHEDVFLPCAAAPAGCPEQMAAELRRCVKEKGFKAGHLVCYCGPRNLDDPSFHAYYAAAQELDVPLLCHPNSVGELTDRFDNFFKLHIAGRPNNCTTALIALVAGACSRNFRGCALRSSNAARNGCSTGCTAWTTTGNGPADTPRRPAAARSRWRRPSTSSATAT